MKDIMLHFVNEVREFIIDYIDIRDRDAVKVLDYLNKAYIQENKLASNFHY